MRSQNDGLWVGEGEIGLSSGVSVQNVEGPSAGDLGFPPPHSNGPSHPERIHDGVRRCTEWGTSVVIMYYLGQQHLTSGIEKFSQVCSIMARVFPSFHVELL